MRFTKMHGAGNDFIILDDRAGEIARDRFPALVRKLCARRLSIGADGVMVVVKLQGDADFGMLFYNADGSLGEMCGNGARCICRYGYENGLAGENQRVETTAGLVTGLRINQRRYRVRLNTPSVVRHDCGVTLNGKTYDCTYVEIGFPGLPHAVIHLENYDQMDRRDLFELGSALRYHPDFPKGANVTFYRMDGENAVKAETFERGVEDFTLACGTGAGSTTVANVLSGRVSGDNTRVSMPGGDLYVTAEFDGDSIKNLYLTGPTNFVASGEVLDEDLVY